MDKTTIRMSHTHGLDVGQKVNVDLGKPSLSKKLFYLIFGVYAWLMILMPPLLFFMFSHSILHGFIALIGYFVSCACIQDFWHDCSDDYLYWRNLKNFSDTYTITSIDENGFTYSLSE